MNRFETHTAEWIRKQVPETNPIYYDICEISQYLEINGKQVYFPDFALISKHCIKENLLD